MSQTLQVINRVGPEDYTATLSLQTNLLDAKVHDRELDDTLILVEHEPVYTVGRSVPFQKLQGDKFSKVKWVEVGRGGKATYHGPGQLVAYPIFDLSRQKQDVHVYLRRLEQVAIRFLAHYGITGYAREGLTGLWVSVPHGGGHKKIASIGIGVRKWITYHGIAINLTNDLSYFQAIEACGQDGGSVISLQQLKDELGSDSQIDLQEAREKLVSAFCDEFSYILEDGSAPANASSNLEQGIKRRSRPKWLKVKAPGSPEYLETYDIIRKHKLVTVCEEARCPNMGECWTHSTATFMIMGDQCTRRCSFCSVKDGTLSNLKPLEPFEPARIAQAVLKLGLKHVVITSVNRDDLPDMGAAHFDKVVKAITHVRPECDIELLIPDMRGRRELVETILQSGNVKVLNHNIETVPRLYKQVRPGAVLKRSLNILRWAREIQPEVRSKSGVMVGLGETRDEVLEVMDQLRESDVQVMTIGQYLQPTPQQLPVVRFVTPDEFSMYREEGLKRGFLHVESGPLVRSSYHAWEHTGEEPPADSSPKFQPTAVAS